MIKTQDLKLQIDELTKQNDMVLIELEQMKKVLMNSGNNQNAQGNGQNQNAQGNGQNQNSQGNGQNQNQDQQNQGSNGGGQQAFSSNQQGQNQSSNQGNSSGQVSNLAYELLQIKGLVEKLEQKTSQYVYSQTSGSLTEKDAVNLVLTLMNGMVDWASEFVSSKSSSSGQLQ